MPISSSAISFTLSGGSSNTDPDKSIGGDPSSQPILNKRLFDDVTEDEAKKGHTDFRCFYVNNDSTTDNLYAVKCFIQTEVIGGANLELGFIMLDERQDVTIINGVNVTGGNFTLTYNDTGGPQNFTVAHNSIISIWAANFQSAIRTIPNLSDVTVFGNQSGNNVVFEINFVGKAAKRWHEALTLNTNALVPATTISIAKVVNGSPINAIAPLLDADSTTPNSVIFSKPLEASPIVIGDLRPLDSFPVWVKRVTAANSDAVENDGITFRIKGSAIA